MDKYRGNFLKFVLVFGFVVIALTLLASAVAKLAEDDASYIDEAGSIESLTDATGEQVDVPFDDTERLIDPPTIGKKTKGGKTKLTQNSDEREELRNKQKGGHHNIEEPSDDMEITDVDMSEKRMKGRSSNDEKANIEAVTVEGISDSDDLSEDAPTEELSSSDELSEEDPMSEVRTDRDGMKTRSMDEGRSDGEELSENAMTAEGESYSDEVSENSMPGGGSNQDDITVRPMTLELSDDLDELSEESMPGGRNKQDDMRVRPMKLELSDDLDELSEENVEAKQPMGASVGDAEAGSKDDNVSIDEHNGETDSGLDLDFDIDCDTVDAFPRYIFAGQSDINVVYDNAHPMPDGIFKSVGFDRYQTVFGIPIIASAGVTEESLREAAHIFAGTIDNDGDGVPDRVAAAESMRDYRTIISYVADAEESEDLWKNLYGKPENEEFRKQFACNMHVFEQWAADATPEYHTSMELRKAQVTGGPSACEEGIEFDWRLWYSPFTWTYYGLQEDFPRSDIETINEAMARAQEAKVFFGNYSEDQEMESADFFVWSVLTNLGALECHCKTDVVESVWKLCTADDLQKFDKDWYNFLQKLEGIPKKLPSVVYKGSALVRNEKISEVGQQMKQEWRSAETVETSVVE